MSDAASIFVPITKVDLERREVWGTIAEEAPDKSGEVFDYASSKPLFEQWSGRALQATKSAGQDPSMGNVRAMHGKVAAGKLIAIEYDDATKRIPVGSKIVDDNEWAKCRDGVYTGFSIGGKYAKRWKDGQLTRYTAEPSEVSLVDNPCMYGATFECVKGSEVELRKFTGEQSKPAITATSDDEVAKRMQLARDHLAKRGVDVDAALAKNRDLFRVQDIAGLLASLGYLLEQLEMDSHPVATKVEESVRALSDALVEMASAATGETSSGGGDAMANDATKGKTAAKAAATEENEMSRDEIVQLVKDAAAEAFAELAKQQPGKGDEAKPTDDAGDGNTTKAAGDTATDTKPDSDGDLAKVAAGVGAIQDTLGKVNDRLSALEKQPAAVGRPVYKDDASTRAQLQDGMQDILDKAASEGMPESQLSKLRVILATKLMPGRAA